MEITRLENICPAYAKLNVSEILDRIEVLAACIMDEPAPEDIDVILGNAEETMELVAALRAHLGLPVPEYEIVNNSSPNA